MLMVAEPSTRASVDGRLARGARQGDSVGSPFSRDQLVEVQRARILAGAIQVVGERGASNIAVAEIVQRAGVSRRTFYDLFADRGECLAATFDDALGVAEASVLPAVREQHGWLARLRAGVNAFMSFLDEQPQLGRLLVCDSLSGGKALADWRAQVVARLVAFVDEGRDQGPKGGEVPAMQAAGSVGGVLAILQNLLAGEEAVSFSELASSLVAMIVMPYLGRAVARRELERPVPQAPVPAGSRSQPLPVLSLKEAGMRLTYRTMRVLLAIAEHPGASNRQIGELAEIGDQGQISKLLRRLQRADLVLNDGLAPGQGAPNVWRLTATGRRLTDGVGADTASVSPLRQNRGKHNPRREK
jgi:AcrR family transcriptional regulator